MKDQIRIKRTVTPEEYGIEIDRGYGWEDWTDKDWKNDIDLLQIRAIKKTKHMSFIEAKKEFGNYPNFPKA